MDLEGILAKRADSPYEHQDGPASWLAILNPAYSRKQRQSQLRKQTARAHGWFPEEDLTSHRLICSMARAFA
jgi:hypothetical protein